MGVFAPFRAFANATPGQITDLTTPTATGTSFAANFSVPSGNITGYQYRIDGGTATELGGGPGTAITNQVTGLAVDVEVRAMNGGTPGPWSNVSVGDPGITLDLLFDTDGVFDAKGSWATEPTGVATTSGSKSYPDVGFPNSAGLDEPAATAAMQQWGRHLRYFINSTGHFQIAFSMGRSLSGFTSNSFPWQKNPTTTSGIASNGWALFAGSFSDLTYAEYRSLVALLPWAEQRAIFPDPGSFPWGSVMRIQNSVKAMIEQTSFTSCILNISFIAGVNYDWDLDTTACAVGRYKANELAWHEYQQSGAFSIGYDWPHWLVYKSSGNIWTNADPATPCYMSIDGGVTNLGNVQTGTPAEKFDLAFVQPYSARRLGTPTGNAMVPGFGGNTGTALQLPAGEANPYLPFRASEDAKQWFAVVPASPWLKAAAGF
jgi:hypothetical protein